MWGMWGTTIVKANGVPYRLAFSLPILEELHHFLFFSPGRVVMCDISGIWAAFGPGSFFLFRLHLESKSTWDMLVVLVVVVILS